MSKLIENLSSGVIVDDVDNFAFIGDDIDGSVETSGTVVDDIDGRAIIDAECCVFVDDDVEADTIVVKAVVHFVLL
jgi:hypothetical protein